MTRILVTGGAGYIGSHALRLLLRRGHQAWAYDNLSYGHRAAVPADRLIVGDLGDAHLLDHVLSERQIEAVMHFAAWTYVGESVRDPAKYYQNNFVNSLALFEAMRRRGVSRIVFSSTCATYGMPQRVPITEDEPQKPVSPYGNSKLAVERALADYAVAYGWGYAALRYFNAAGASPEGDLGEDHRPETHLIPLTLAVALGKRSHLDIFGTDYPTPDGTCIRDYIHVDDLGEAHRLVLERLQAGKGLCYNLGTGKGYSVREVVRTVEEVSGKKVPVRESARRPGDPPVLVASAVKFEREVGWAPRYAELKPIVQTAWHWFSAHPDGYGDQPSS